MRSTRTYNVKRLGGVPSELNHLGAGARNSFFSRGAIRGRHAITNFSSRRSSRHRCLYHTRLVYNFRRDYGARLTTRRTRTTSGNLSRGKSATRQAVLQAHEIANRFAILSPALSGDRSWINCYIRFVIRLER